MSDKLRTICTFHSAKQLIFGKHAVEQLPDLLGTEGVLPRSERERRAIASAG